MCQDLSTCHFWPVKSWILTSGESLSQLGVQNKDLDGVRLILCRRLFIAMKIVELTTENERKHCSGDGY